MRRWGALQGAGALIALLVALAANSAPARAATSTVTTPSTPFYGPTLITPVKPGEKMLVESDQLVYDYDHKTVAAVGHVRIYYGQYTLQADRVTYNETTGRLVADGSVHLIDPTGNEFRSTRRSRLTSRPRARSGRAATS